MRLLGFTEKVCDARIGGFGENFGAQEGVGFDQRQDGLLAKFIGHGYIRFHNCHKNRLRLSYAGGRAEVRANVGR